MGNKKKKESRRERERRMIEEMESALYGNKMRSVNAVEETDETENESGVDGAQTAKKPQEKQPPVKPAKKEKTGKTDGQTLHCPRCRTVMENGKCPQCGYYVYVPMSKEKRNKIRWIVGGVCLIGFAILFVVMQFKN